MKTKKFLIAFALIGFIACSKNGGDNEKPVINLTTPTANQQFTAGQTINITGTVSDNDEIHEVHVIVTNKTTSTEILHFHDHIDAKTYNINQSLVAAAGITYKIHVEADDHTGNTAVVEIEVNGI